MSEKFEIAKIVSQAALEADDLNRERDPQIVAFTNLMHDAAQILAGDRAGEIYAAMGE